MRRSEFRWNRTQRHFRYRNADQGFGKQTAEFKNYCTYQNAKFLSCGSHETSSLRFCIVINALPMRSGRRYNFLFRQRPKATGLRRRNEPSRPLIVPKRV